MGLPEEEVGQLNLREFEALLNRKQEERNRERYNVGLVWSAIYNCAPFGDANRKPASPLDLVPDWKKKEAKPDLTQMTPEEQKNYLFNIFCKANYKRR